MKTFEVIKVALLVVIAISGAITAYEVRKIAKEEFDVELTVEQEEEIMNEVEQTASAAFNDMSEEGE